MSQSRRCRGSAISEFGPAMFLLLVIIFFPMLDMLGLAAGYIMAGIYHDYMIRELALSAPPPTGGQTPDPAIQSEQAAIDKITANFQSSAFFSFLNMKPGDLGCDPGKDVSYLPDASNPSTVQCTTRTTISPFISIPFWGTCPGLNAPYTFAITTQRPQEEKGRN